jgi:hypothetical protein
MTINNVIFRVILSRLLVSETTGLGSSGLIIHFTQLKGINVKIKGASGCCPSSSTDTEGPARVTENSRVSSWRRPFRPCNLPSAGAVSRQTLLKLEPGNIAILSIMFRYQEPAVLAVHVGISNLTSGSGSNTLFTYLVV